jgi:hypothetical protein
MLQHEAIGLSYPENLLTCNANLISFIFKGGSLLGECQYNLFYQGSYAITLFSLSFIEDT